MEIYNSHATKWKEPQSRPLAVIEKDEWKKIRETFCIRSEWDDSNEDNGYFISWLFSVCGNSNYNGNSTVPTSENECFLRLSCEKKNAIEPICILDFWVNQIFWKGQCCWMEAKERKLRGTTAVAMYTYPSYSTKGRKLHETLWMHNFVLLRQRNGSHEVSEYKNRQTYHFCHEFCLEGAMKFYASSFVHNSRRGLFTSFE